MMSSKVLPNRMSGKKASALFFPLIALSSIVTNVYLLTTWRVHVSTRIARQTTTTRGMDFWVSQHMQWHDDNMYNRNARKLVYDIVTSQGLGDQLKAMNQLYSYAVLSRRMLLINWTKPHPIEAIMSERARRRFIYRPHIHGVEGVGKDYKFRWGQPFPMSMRRHLAGDERMVFFRTSSVTCRRRHGKSGMCKVPDVERDLVGKRSDSFPAPPYDYRMKRLVTKMVLDPSDELMRSVRVAQAQLGLCAYKPEVDESSCTNGSNHYLTVHARLGVGTNELHEARFARTVGKEERVAHCLARAVMRYADNDSPVVLVASDSKDWRPLFRRALLKYRPKARVAFYQAPTKHYRHLHGRDAIMRTHVENLLMAQGKKIMALKSSFARVAGWRGDSENVVELSVGKCIESKMQVKVQFEQTYRTQ